MITRNGIYYDLTKSCYRLKVNDYIFVFSSQLHLKNYKLKLNENREKINNSLTNRFKITVDVSELADIILYRKIETRGFLIVTKGGTELCQKDIKCVGAMRMLTD